METNGRNSCTGNSRHIDIRYFFVKDRIDKKELSVQYTPTHHMLADFFTKPLQGSLFRRFRDILMGQTSIDSLYASECIEKKERVENVTEKLLFPNNHVPINYQPKPGKMVKFKDSFTTYSHNPDDEECKKEKNNDNYKYIEESKTNSAQYT